MDPATKSAPANSAVQEKFARLWYQMTEDCNTGHPGSLIRARSGVSLQTRSEFRTRFDYVGFCQRVEMADLLYSGSYRARPRLNRNGQRTVRRGPGPGKNYFLRADEWNELVVIPHQVTKGQYCGVALTDFEYPHPPLIYRSLPGTQFPRTEGGLGMLGALDNVKADWGNTLFATLQTMPAIYAQYYYLRQCGGQSTLPLVTCVQNHYYATKLAWHALRDKKVVLFDNKYSLNLFRQARLADGMIAVLPDVFERFQNCFYSAPRTLLEILKLARPWREVLYKLLGKASQVKPAIQNQLAKFLVDLRWPREQYADLFWATAQSRRAFNTLAKTPAFKPILQKLGRLRNASVPSDAQRCLWPTATSPAAIDVQIEYKLVTSDQDGYFQGVLTDLAGAKVPFLATAATLRKQGLIDTVRQEDRHQGHTLSLPPEETWPEYQRVLDNPYLHRIEQAEQVGFVQRTPTQSWECCLPQFGIRQGDVQTKFKTPLLLDDTPGRAIAPPAALTKEAIAPYLELSASNNLFWAAQLLVYQQLIALPEGHTPWPVAVVGKRAEEFAACLARALDTAQLEAPSPRSWDFHLQQMNRRTSRYRWPVCVQSAGRMGTTLVKYFQEAKSQNLILSLPETLQQEAMRAKWAVLAIAEAAEWDQEWETAFRAVLLDCLRRYPGPLPPAAWRRKAAWLTRVVSCFKKNFKPVVRLQLVLSTAKRLIALPEKTRE